MDNDSNIEGTKDWRELGYSPELRSAEIVAGLRAATLPSPESVGLSTPVGRWFAHLFLNMVNDSGVMNATAGRAVCITELAKEVIYRGEPPKKIVELAAGFGARGLALSQAFPQTEVYEIDLPDIIKLKQERLRGLDHGTLPSNMHWMGVDLRNVSLPDLLGKGSIDLVITEGVFPYFEHEVITKIAASVRECLTENGVLITDLVSGSGWGSVENLSKMATFIFHRQMGAFKGRVDSLETANAIFERAGFATVQVASLKELSSFYIPDKPMADVSYVVAAFK